MPFRRICRLNSTPNCYKGIIASFLFNKITLPLIEINQVRWGSPFKVFPVVVVGDTVVFVLQCTCFGYLICFESHIV